MTELRVNNDLARVISDFSAKYNAVSENIAQFEQAVLTMKTNSCVLSTYGNVNILPSVRLYEESVKKNLRSSAWRCLYNMLQIDRLASAKDKKRFEEVFETAPEFNVENVKAAFCDYLENPRNNILRGLAEVFCGLDDSYKSHSNVKIGVKGLPKRVIISNITNIYSYGMNKIRDILNALAQFQGIPLVETYELNSLFKDGDSLKEGFEFSNNENTIKTPSRGVWLKRFANGNGHLFFSEKCLRDINLALAEYYGEVLPDCYEHTNKPTNTDVCKDLQFYRTPKEVAERLVNEIYLDNGFRVLEPSCGDGALLDALQKRNCNLKTLGIEIDHNRAMKCRDKGHSVVVDNFLNVPENPVYDVVVMNPPFYGKHYEKHIRHAIKFLKVGGKLRAILPASAKYDHKLLDDLKGTWSDLPVGSFSESGTNVNTCIFSFVKKE